MLTAKTYTPPAISAGHNIALAAGLVLLQLIQFFLLPAIIATHGAYWGLLLLPLLPAGNVMWSLIHEAIHRIFHPRAAVNDYWGRGLSIALGVPFDLLKFGHLMHHRFNRDWEAEFYNPGKQSRALATLHYYAKLCGGLYVVEQLAALLFLLPIKLVRKLFSYHARTALAHIEEITGIADNYFFLRGRTHSVRLDTLLILLVYGLSFYLYRAHWPWFFLMFFGRAFTISFMDNIYHYATPADNSIPAKEISSPRWLTLCLLHGNHHHSHHCQANVPWKGLPDLQQALQINYHQSFWRAALDQFKGPILKY